MALPDDKASSEPVIADFVSPYNRYTGLLEDFETGPVALNDASQGLDVQIWYLSYNDDEESPGYGEFTVTAEDTGETAVVITVENVTRVGLGFNQNGDPFICYETRGCEAKYYYYDTVAADYVTATLPAGSKHVACCLDDHRDSQTGDSDTILAYIRAGTLYYRQERDRFLTERSLGSVGAGFLYKVGMTENLRLKFDVREGSGVRLSEIVGDLCALVAIPGNRIDVASLYPIIVRGFKSSGVYSAAGAIRSLQPLYSFDFPQIDGKLVAVRRGNVVQATISQNDLVADREFRFESAREQGVEFPKKLHLAYASAETDYTPTKSTSERRSRDIRSQSEDSIESAVNFEALEAAERVHIMHKILWAEFEGKAKFSLPESYAYLVPSDPIMLEVREDTYKRMRITKYDRVDGAIDCEAVIDRGSAYAVGNITLPDATTPGTTNPSIGVPTTEPPEPPSPTIPGDTTWEFMDLPALITSHDTLGYYVAGHGDAGTAWNGFQLQRDVGGEWEPVVSVSNAEKMGQLEAALGYGSRYVPDTTNTILVSLTSAPASVSDALLYKGKGAWLVGDEIIQVRDWVAEGDNWRGSHLLRGRLDTTPVAHSSSERVVYLGAPTFVTVDPSLRDTTLTLRAVSFGQVGSDATEGDYPYIGRSQEEWAPIDLEAAQDGNDWGLSWTPRYSMGSSANPIPSSQFYGWRIRFTVGATVITKNISSITPEYTYTEAAQTADFGSAQSSFDSVEIRALNHFGGQGKALTTPVS